MNKEEKIRELEAVKEVLKDFGLTNEDYAIMAISEYQIIVDNNDDNVDTNGCHGMFF